MSKLRSVEVQSLLESETSKWYPDELEIVNGENGYNRPSVDIRNLRRHNKKLRQAKVRYKS